MRLGIPFPDLPEAEGMLVDTVIMSALAYLAQPENFTAYTEWVKSKFPDPMYNPDDMRAYVIMNSITPAHISRIYYLYGKSSD